MIEIKWTHRTAYKGFEIRYTFNGVTRVLTYLYKGEVFTVENVNPFLIESALKESLGVLKDEEN